MSFPHFKDKYNKKSFFSAIDYQNYKLKKFGKKREAPERMILCYQPSLMKHIKKNYQTYQKDNLLVVDNNGAEVGICGNFGIGAPRAVIVLEDMVASGAKRFVSVGSAGSLQKSLNIGELALIDRAIRDEGTSHHYLAKEKFSYPSESLLNKMQQVIEQRKLNFQRGASWTTDAPYRETIDEITAYQKEGILTVEMEAAALYAAAQFLQVDLISLLMISDSLADLKWNPQFVEIEEKQLQLFEIALEVLR